MLVEFEKACPSFPAEAATIRPGRGGPDITKSYVEDIILIGGSLAKKEPIAGIRAAYSSLPAEEVERDLDNPTVLKEVVRLLLQDNAQLKNKVAILEARLDLNDPNTSIPHSDNVVDPVSITGQGDMENVDPIDEVTTLVEIREVRGVEPRPVIGVVKTTDVYIGGGQKALFTL